MIVTYTRDGSNATVSVNAAPKNPATPIPTYVVLAYASSFVPNPKSDPEPTPRAVGDWVWIEDFGNFMSINPVNIISDQSFENGHLVRESSPFIMDVSGASVTFIWNGSLWKVFNNRGS